MVKKIINRFLGRSDSPVQPPANIAEVPDELPPLAEDIMSDLPPPPQPVQQQVQQPIQQQMQQPIQSQQMEEPPLPPMQETIQPEAQENLPRISMSRLYATEAHPTLSQEDDAQGFFNNILKIMQKQGIIKDKFFEKDLFSRMEKYWKENEGPHGSISTGRKKVEYDILNKLSELKNLEEKWRIQRQVLEHDKKFLKEREHEIKSLINDLSTGFKNLRYFQDVSPDQYFHFRNGMVAKNLGELIDILLIIDDATFTYHVNHHKNDIALWIMNALKDNDLAETLKRKHIKEDFIRELTKTLAASEEELNIEEMNAPPLKIREDLNDFIIDPKHYFWLKNGIVLKSVKDLYENLKTMDSETFYYHVSDHKNDFADWIQNIFLQDDLSLMMRKIFSRDELIKLLQAYI